MNEYNWSKGRGNQSLIVLVLDFNIVYLIAM
jgi:hypothetical protein